MKEQAEFILDILMEGTVDMVDTVGMKNMAENMAIMRKNMVGTKNTVDIRNMVGTKNTVDIRNMVTIKSMETIKIMKNNMKNMIVIVKAVKVWVE
jgi:hypothetical protein